AIRRLARRGRVKRISGHIYEDTRGVCCPSVRERHSLWNHTALDVVYVLERSGHTLYGFG
ncbi:hypothetical protein BGW80DRAFT_1125246, partial [Lactifluus volemus]